MDNNSDRKFAGFVMTYERPEIILDTISKIFEQSLPPEKLLIVDNSETDKTQKLIEGLGDSRLGYFRVGHNAGPAGAAKIGLQKLVLEGYDWIYWGDDDDPPAFPDMFERLLILGDTQNVKPGIVGCVGQYFNRRKGDVIRVTDELLSNSDFVKVDSIAGNQSMIINTEVVRKGILPDERLFFGFEELDFCLRVKKAGFNLLVPCDLFIRSRVKYNRINLEKPIYIKQEISKLPRQYYSIRNMLFILKSNNLWIALIFQIAKSIAKAVYAFRYGMEYGRLNLKWIARGLLDGIMDRLGKLK